MELRCKVKEVYLKNIMLPQDMGGQIKIVKEKNPSMLSI